jgi:hypothetical protein
MNKHADRKTRSDKGQIDLTDRDLRVLRWIAEQYAARFDQVLYLLGLDAGPRAKSECEISASAARQVIARWRRAGWIVQKKVFYQDPPWLYPTARLLRLLDLPYKAHEPSITRLNHIFGVNEVRLALADVRPQYEWISERQMRSAISYTWGMSLPHLSDGKLITDKGTIILELEITAKHPSALLAVLEELTSTYCTIWYFVDSQVRPILEAACNKLDPALAANVFLYSYSSTEGLDTTEGWAMEE